MAHGELIRPVVKLAPVFYDGFSKLRNRTGDVAASSNQQQEPLEVGTDNLYLARFLEC